MWSESESYIRETIPVGPCILKSYIVFIKFTCRTAARNAIVCLMHEAVDVTIDTGQPPMKRIECVSTKLSLVYEM